MGARGTGVRHNNITVDIWTEFRKKYNSGFSASANLILAYKKCTLINNHHPDAQYQSIQDGIRQCLPALS